MIAIYTNNQLVCAGVPPDLRGLYGHAVRFLAVADANWAILVIDRVNREYL